MNRQQRRQAQKAIPKYRRGMTQEDRVKALLKNGITPDDMQKSFEEGYRAGWTAGANNMLKTSYAAFILALREHFRFWRKRCKRVLQTADHTVMTSLGHEELVEQVWEDIGLRLNFDEPFDRIEEVA